MKYFDKNGTPIEIGDIVIPNITKRFVKSKGYGDDFSEEYTVVEFDIGGACHSEVEILFPEKS